MPRVGFETTTPVFERAKTVNALDRAATVIGLNAHTSEKSQEDKHKVEQLTIWTQG
jgi:hypothetical protein